MLLLNVVCLFFSVPKLRFQISVLLSTALKCNYLYSKNTIFFFVCSSIIKMTHINPLTLLCNYHILLLCSVDRASRYNSCKWPTWRTIPNLYMFRALMCSSSGELIVSIRYMVFVTLCRWPPGMQVWVPPKPACQTVTYIEWHIPDIVLIQLILLIMSTWVLETCRDLE